MASPKGLRRREILERALLLTGMAMVPGEMVAAVSTAAKRSRLDQPTRKLISAIADTIIPATDTPGALAVGVPGLFEDMLAQWASPTHRSLMLAALQRIDDAARTAEGNGFAALTADQRYTVLSAIDAQSAMSDPGYGQLKSLITTLYYVSETGSTVELRYEQIPGSWDPSIPVTPDTRAQGGLGLF